jgi:hypothetical protein
MRRSGQTIVESMVAISLLIIGFLGMIILINRSIGINRVVTDNYTATYLAAEGIEVTKNLIDGNFVQGSPWFSGFSSCTSGCDWEVQYDTTWDPGHQPVAYGARPLYYNPANGLYAYDAFGQQTSFTRRVHVTLEGAGNNEISVHSIVMWHPRGGGTAQIDLEDHFFNWYGQ